MAPPSIEGDVAAAAASTSENVDPAIYAKSGDISKHLEGVQKQYDTKEKREFYLQVMGDGTSSIHFGKWDGIDLEEEGAYGKASLQMTDYMYVRDHSHISLAHKG